MARLGHGMLCVNRPLLGVSERCHTTVVLIGRMNTIKMRLVEHSCLRSECHVGYIARVMGDPYGLLCTAVVETPALSAHF